MGFGVGIILIAVGAVLAWAVHANSNSVNIHTVGIILFIVGLVATAISAAFWSTWAGPGYFTRSSRSRSVSTTTTADGGRRSIVEEDVRTS